MLVWFYNCSSTFLTFNKINVSICIICAVQEVFCFFPIFIPFGTLIFQLFQLSPIFVYCMNKSINLRYDHHNLEREKLFKTMRYCYLFSKSQPKIEVIWKGVDTCRFRLKIRPKILTSCIILNSLSILKHRQQS